MAGFLRGAALGIALAATLPAGGATAASEPLVGVACRGGFFVRSPDNAFFWVGADNVSRTPVYAGPNQIVGMAECGDGVISVFDTSAGQRRSFVAYFSADCTAIAEATGGNKLLYDGRVPVRRIAADGDGVAIRLADGTAVRDPICRPPE